LIVPRLASASHSHLARRSSGIISHSHLSCSSLLGSCSAVLGIVCWPAGSFAYRGTCEYMCLCVHVYRVSVAIWAQSSDPRRLCSAMEARTPTVAELAVCARLAATKAKEAATLAANTAWETFQADLLARQSSLSAKTHSVQMEGLAHAAEAAAAAAEAAAEADTVSESSTRHKPRRSRSRSTRPRRHRSHGK
jgi:hypothetical protein